MKKFKKSKRRKEHEKKDGGNPDKSDISSLYYWGDKNILMASSWDRKVRLYDDSTADQQGSKRYTMKKHNDSVNYLDFNQKH